MPLDTDDFINSLDVRVSDIIDACTGCGKCVEVCPTPAIVGVDDVPDDALAVGVIDILKGEVGPDTSAVWAQNCMGSGHCVDVCAEGINPRFMLAMARRALHEARDPSDNKAAGRKAFKSMSTGVRMLSRLQMPPEVLAKLNPPANRDKPEDAPELIFYTGCNLLKTPHIGLLCLDVFDRLGIRYEVYGGPSNCCGILQFRPGDTDNSARQALTTVDRFQQTGAADVVAWCPTCHIQFSEVIMPSAPKVGQPYFDIHMLPVFLHSKLDELRPHLTHAVNKKVALFEFPGAKGVTEAVIDLLNAVPGVEIVDLGIERAGYHMSSLEKVPDYRSQTIAEALRKAEDEGVDALLSIFHGDHRELSSHSPSWPFEVLNYMDILGASMGIDREDLFQRLKAMHDVDGIVAEMAKNVEDNNLDLEKMREAVATYMLGEQFLPIDRASHPD